MCLDERKKLHAAESKSQTKTFLLCSIYLLHLAMQSFLTENKESLEIYTDPTPLFRLHRLFLHPTTVSTKHIPLGNFSFIPLPALVNPKHRRRQQHQAN